ncbi:MAG: outer membrane beta-barrel protein [Paucibacter sp.]|nr:outer membrane beta-barrel protein [Roseateles sp.]
MNSKLTTNVNSAWSSSPLKHSGFTLRPSVAAAIISAMVCGPIWAADAEPVAASANAGAKCDPYKNYECLDDYLGTGFWERLSNYYELEMGQGGGPSDPKAPPARRDYFPPAAQPAPPMPFTEWPYGGTTSLGVTRPNSVDSPLMTALSNTSLGKWMGDNNLQFYGWVNVGANVSTSTTKPGGNAPAAYLYTPNTVQLDQAVLYLDRFPDTVQKEHIDWGLRISAIYGVDYRYTTAYGLASDQLLKHNKVNGYDFPMLYGEIFIPQVAEGLMVRVGRYISLPDIEAQLAPNNYMYTHSMTYTFDNYTNTGIQTSLAVDKNWILQFGVSVGTEAMPNHTHQKVDNPYPNVPGSQPGQVGYNPLYPDAKFKVDPGSMPTFTLCGRWNADDGKTDVNVCANGINKGTYGYNNLQWYGLTAYHAFDEKWHIAWEAYHLFQTRVPNSLNSDVQAIYSANGSPFSSQFMPYNAPNLAICRDAAMLTCTAGATGTVAYLNYSPDALNNFSIRPELFWDPQGQRTGVAARFINLAVGWQHWFSPQIEVRPELAYYHSKGAPAFNGNSNAGIAPNKSNQTILSGDLIFHF